MSNNICVNLYTYFWYIRIHTNCVPLFVLKQS